MDQVQRAMAGLLLRPSATSGDKLIAAILSTPPIEGEEETSRREQLRLEEKAIHEAARRAHLDEMRRINAISNPTFEQHLEEVRRQHGLA